MSKNTMTDLPKELNRILPDNPLIEVVVNEAIAGEYHDFKNNKYTCGKVALVNVLKNLSEAYPNHEKEFLVIRDDVINGEYDEPMDESDQAHMRDEIDADVNMTIEQKKKMKEMMGL